MLLLSFSGDPRTLGFWALEIRTSWTLIPDASCGRFNVWPLPRSAGLPRDALLLAQLPFRHSSLESPLLLAFHFSPKASMKSGTFLIDVDVSVFLCLPACRTIAAL
jgi:hypothetical protein